MNKKIPDMINFRIPSMNISGLEKEKFEKPH